MKIHTYKTVISLLAISILTVACKKDEITVQKNENLKWEIDKEITDADIRTHIGYDPREQQAYFYRTDADMPMYSLATLPLDQERTSYAILNLTNKTKEDTKAQLVYDAALYDKIKDKYQGYELGEASTVQLKQSEITIPKGENLATFEFVTTNKSNLDKKLILPFTLKVANDTKILKDNEHFVLKVFPQKISIKVKNQWTTRNVSLKVETNELTIDNGTISYEVLTDTKIGKEFTLGLVRDETYTKPDAAPDGVYTEIERVSFQDVLSAKLTFKLQNLERFTKRTSVLAFKLMAYDSKGNAYLIPDAHPKVTIYLGKTFPNNYVTASNSAATPTGAKITGVTAKFTLSGAVGHNVNHLLDGNLTTYADFSTVGRSQGLQFHFNKVRKVKYIRFKADASTPIKSLRVATTGAATLGNVHFSSTNDWYVLTLKKPLPLDEIRFANFDKNKSFKIYEVEFYEE